MERIVLTAPDGMIYTDGKTYGAKIWLEVGRSKDVWTERESAIDTS